MPRENLIKIRSGESIPTDGVLADKELGYVTSTKKLYIGSPSPNLNPSPEDGGAAIELSDVYIGNSAPPDDSGYKIWISVGTPGVTLQLPLSSTGVIQIPEGMSGIQIIGDLPADRISGALNINNGGTGSADGAQGLANLFAAGLTKLSSYQYGDSLPEAGNAGRIFFKKI